MTTLLLPGDIPRAAALLRRGELVAFGTETVYGLGADACNAEAVAGIFEAKGRPRFNPLICHYATARAAFADVDASPMAQILAEDFWPGPLTLVLPRRPDCRIARLAGAGLATLAVRVPAHPLARGLIEALGHPIAAPSANLSGRISPTCAAHVLAQLDGRIAAILDSGPCMVGLESTVLDLSGAAPQLLRPGGVPLEALVAAIGPIGSAPLTGLPRSPGQLPSHYAPGLPLRLDAVAAAPDEALLAFGPPPKAPLSFQLSETGDLKQAAARLFEGLHWLDDAAQRRGLRRIAAMPIPPQGLGLAIQDRLTRAAAPR